ncbi:homoserine O-acetyltransferase [Pseudomassariella vexata]|uniref:Homoserine O-acetyltransferase n=1 Tax=Pseudomassariella vexata TaxID=1141098 RepID=A0A1Y2E093_9PEZI|nr:homoserine O-acetyltransferase [Pseudomassariella vexata]ORY64295.1 homoserine O-acetyltransferase [Pseudomassariella vexata]
MAYAAYYKNLGLDYYSIPNFAFACGTTLQDVRIAYRIINHSAARGTVLIPTCYGGLINTTLNFTTAPNDCLKAYRVIVTAMLGNGESASPSNTPGFPESGELRYQDVVNAQYRLLTKHLGVQQLEAIIGFSMGGQQAYHWAVMFPDFARRIVPICSSARTSPHNYAFLEGPMAALTSSADYLVYRATKIKVVMGEIKLADLRQVQPASGKKAFARAYAAWLTSSHWFRERWWGTRDGGQGFESIEAWMQDRETAYLDWDADDMLALASMWQMGDVSTVIPGQEVLSQRGGKQGDDGGYHEALTSIKARVLVMPCQTDQYFPPEDGETECKHLARGTFAPIPSVWGHVAGGGMDLEAVAWMNKNVGRFMDEELYSGK